MGKAAAVSHAGHHIRLSDGTGLHYVDSGGNGPAVVFLHGYTDSWRNFEALFPTLGSAFRLVAYDQRGHGNSSRAAAYDIAALTEDAVGIIERVVGKPVHLVGHSLGSIVAQRVVAARPDLLKTLTLIGATRTARGHPALKELRQELEAFGDGVPLDFIEFFQRGTTEVPLSDAQLTVFVGESAKLHPQTWIGALSGMIDEPQEIPALPADVPVLSLWGENDSIFDRDAQSALALDAPWLTAIHYAGVGHAPHWEIPSRVAEDISAFLRAHDPSAIASQGGQKADS